MKHNRRDAKREIASLCRLIETTQCTADNLRELKDKVRSIEASMRDGEPERDEAEIEARRAVLAQNQGLSDVFNTMWMTVAVMTDENNCLTKRGYVRFFLVLAKVLGSYVSEEETRVSVEEDWEHDTEVYGPISKTVFFDLIFEVIETWAVFVEKTYFAAFAWALLDGVAELRSQPPKLRPLRLVRCVMQAMDEGKILSAYYDPSAQRDRVQLKLQASVMDRIPDVQKRLASRRTGSALIDEGHLVMIAAIARKVQTPPAYNGEDIFTDSDDEEDGDKDDAEGGDGDGGTQQEGSMQQEGGAVNALSEGSVASQGSYFRRLDEARAAARSKSRGTMGGSSSGRGSGRDSWLYRESAASGVEASSFSNWMKINKASRDFGPAQFDLEGYRLDDAGQRVPLASAGQDAGRRQSGSRGSSREGVGYLSSTEASASRVSTRSRGSSRGKARPRSSDSPFPGSQDPLTGLTSTDSLGNTLPFLTHTMSEVAAALAPADDSLTFQVVPADSEPEAEGDELAALMATLADVSARSQAAKQAAAEEQAREEARRLAAAAEAAEQARLAAAKARERAEAMRRDEERERQQDEAKLSLFFAEILHRELVVTPAKLRRQALALDKVEREGEPKPSVDTASQEAPKPLAALEAQLSEEAVKSPKAAVSSVYFSIASPQQLSPPSIGAPSPRGLAVPAYSSRLFVGEGGNSSYDVETDASGLRLRAEPTLESFLFESSILSSSTLRHASLANSLSRSPSPPAARNRSQASLSEPSGSSVLKAFPHELYSDVVKQVAKEGRGAAQPWGHQRAARFRKRPVGRALATPAERAAHDLLALQALQASGPSASNFSGGRPMGAEGASTLAPSRAVRAGRLSPQRGRPGPSAHALLTLLHDGPAPALLSKAQRIRLERDKIRRPAASAYIPPGVPSAAVFLNVKDTDSLASMDSDTGAETYTNAELDAPLHPLYPLHPHPSSRPITDTLPDSAILAFSDAGGGHISFAPDVNDEHDDPAARPFAPHTSCASLPSHSAESFLALDSLSFAPPEVFIGDFAPRARHVSSSSGFGSGSGSGAGLVGVQVAVGPRGSFGRRRGGEGEGADEGGAGATHEYELTRLSTNAANVDRASVGSEHERETGPASATPLAPLSPLAASAPPLLSPIPGRSPAPGAFTTSKAASLSVRSYVPAVPGRTLRESLPVLVLERAMDVDQTSPGADAVAAEAGALGLAGPVVAPSPEVLRTSQSLALLQGPRPGLPLTLTRVLGPSTSSPSSAPWLPGGLLDEMEHNRSSKLLAWAEQRLLREHSHSDPAKVVLSVKRQEGVRRCFDEYALGQQAPRAHNDASFLHFASREHMASAAVLGSKKGTHGFAEKFSPHKRAVLLSKGQGQEQAREER